MRTAAARSVWNWLAAFVVLLSPPAAAAWAGEQPDATGSDAVRLWDTLTPLQGPADVTQRRAWRAVTTAASGHLQGDLVVETDGLLAAFASRLGKALLWGSAEPLPVETAVRPTELSGKQAVIASIAIAEQNGVVIAEADFRAPGAEDLPITFAFTGDRIVAVRPEGSTRGVTLSAPIELAVVPSFVGDDLIYDPGDYPAATTLSVPSEHLLLGLLKGEGSMLVMAWQEAMPSIRLELSSAGRGQRSVEAVSFVGGRGISLAMLGAPGIWHRERLDPSFLERDVAIQWRPPFPAVWLTQLYEDEVKTTFEFRHEREEHWRGGIGSYILPAWFSDGRAMLSLGKQIVPEGEAIIYFLERSDQTPEQVESPIDIAQRALAGDVLIGVLNADGRPTWWPQRPDATIGGETCNVTDVLKGIFDAGQEVEKQIIVRGGVEDMCFHLEVMFERNGRYYPFARDMIAYLDAQADAKPELAPYLHEMRAIAEQMIATYDSARDSLRDMDYAHELGAKTVALAAEKRPDNRERMINLKQEWIGMGGAAEELSRREHSLARKLYQQAAYRAAGTPEGVAVAEEIRRRTKQCLQRPDSYEIWENY
jgi:hypothetical protein